MENFTNRIDHYLNSLIEPWKAAGLVVGIVQNNQVLFKQSYGYKKFNSEKMETDHLFAIGSASKAFTSAAIAILIKQGKIKSWDDKVIDYLPTYRASDEYAQNNMTLKDLLSMRSGYSRKGLVDMLFHGSHYSMDEIIDKSRYIPFDIAFRDRMHYDNLNYMLLGKIIETASGMTWHAFIQKEIFEKLGMTHSGSTYDFAMNRKDMTTPHLFFDGEIHQIPLRNIDNAAPAGSIVSNVDDMLLWTQFQLSDGNFGGHSLINKNDMRKMHTPHTVVDMELFGMNVFDDVLVPAYGLGWFVYEINGVGCIGHGGHIDGFSSFVLMIPSCNAGIVILNNSDHNDISQPILRKIAFMLCEKEPSYDYDKNFLEHYIKKLESYTRQYKELLTELDTKGNQPADLIKYCGKYHSALFSTQTIELKDGKLHVERFDWIGSLHPLHENTFVALWDNDLTHPPLKFEFIEENGIPVGVEVEMFGRFMRE